MEGNPGDVNDLTGRDEHEDDEHEDEDEDGGGDEGDPGAEKAADDAKLTDMMRAVEKQKAEMRRKHGRAATDAAARRAIKKKRQKKPQRKKKKKKKKCAGASCSNYAGKGFDYCRATCARQHGALGPSPGMPRCAHGRAAPWLCHPAAVPPRGRASLPIWH
jgi:hypothetical protein